MFQEEEATGEEVETAVEEAGTAVEETATDATQHTSEDSYDSEEDNDFSDSDEDANFRGNSGTNISRRKIAEFRIKDLDGNRIYISETQVPFLAVEKLSLIQQISDDLTIKRSVDDQEGTGLAIAPNLFLDEEFEALREYEVTTKKLLESEVVKRFRESFIVSNGSQLEMLIAFDRTGVIMARILENLLRIQMALEIIDSEYTGNYEFKRDKFKSIPARISNIRSEVDLLVYNFVDLGLNTDGELVKTTQRAKSHLDRIISAFSLSSVNMGGISGMEELLKIKSHCQEIWEIDKLSDLISHISGTLGPKLRSMSLNVNISADDTQKEFIKKNLIKQ